MAAFFCSPPHWEHQGPSPLQRAGVPFFLLRRVELAQRLLVKKLSLSLRRGAKMQQMEQVLARMVARKTFEVVHDGLSAQRSLPAHAFLAATIRTLLERHRTQARLLDTLSPMLSVELSKLQVETAYRLVTRRLLQLAQRPTTPRGTH